MTQLGPVNKHTKHWSRIQETHAQEQAKQAYFYVKYMAFVPHALYHYRSVYGISAKRLQYLNHVTLFNW